MLLCRLKQRVTDSLRLKLALLLSVVTAVLTITFTGYFIANERISIHARLVDKGDLLASVLANSLQIPLYAGHAEEVARQVTEIFSFRDIDSIQVFTSSGELIATVGTDDTQPDDVKLTVRKQVFSHGGFQTPTALLLGDSQPDQLIGMIILTLDAHQLTRTTNTMLLSAILIAFIFWIATTSITFLVLGRVTRTFHQLMVGVKNIEAGDLSVRIPASGNDEPGRALAAINSLAEALLNKNEENKQLQAEIVKGLRTELDEEKSRNMAKLIQTNRMTSLGLLVSSMAHEINNPNSAIRLAGEILEKAWHDALPILDELSREEGDFTIGGLPYSHAAEDIETAVDAILRSSTRIERVVQNLRGYSLGERDNQQISCQLNRIAENAVTIVRAHGKMEGVVITTQLAAELPSIIANPFQIEQVVINLILNAIQAMAGTDGSEITLVTEAAVDTNEVLLVVQDSGPGIKAEDLPHVFEPFFSTRIDEGGSGLGLYISNFLVKEQNGTLELVNNESGGCRAVIRLKSAHAA
jgi:signal transduction histidine kinase